MNALLKSQFWLTNLKGNAVLFVLAFTINWIKKPWESNDKSRISHLLARCWGNYLFVCQSAVLFIYPIRFKKIAKGKAYLDIELI